MITDFHVHTFPDKIADKALASLSKSGKVKYYLNGTLKDTLKSMKEADIAYSVLLPVATNAGQYQSINNTAKEIQSHHEETGIFSFGGIHPDNDNYKEILRDLKANGVRGIKLHPVFQETYLDDIKNLRIIDYACELDLLVITHAGYDISFPGIDLVTPKHILPVIEKTNPGNLILAHMGGWGCWDEVESDLAGSGVWFDTSFTLTPLRDPVTHQILTERTAKEQLNKEQFLRIVRKHGAEHILFGSDSPWSEQKEALELLQSSGITKTEYKQITETNAKTLLSLS